MRMSFAKLKVLASDFGNAFANEKPQFARSVGADPNATSCELSCLLGVISGLGMMSGFIGF